MELFKFCISFLFLQEDYPEEDEDVGMQMKPGLGLDNKEKISPSVGETLYRLWQRIIRVMDFDLLNDTVNLFTLKNKYIFLKYLQE